MEFLLTAYDSKCNQTVCTVVKVNGELAPDDISTAVNKIVDVILSKETKASVVVA